MTRSADGSSDSIEFEDERSRRIHSELQSNDKDGNYASFFQHRTHQILENDVNIVPPGYRFSLDRVVAVEVYSPSDKERLRLLLLNMARRIQRKDSRAYERAIESIERAVDRIASEKKSRSYHFIDGLVVPARSKLFKSYRVKIESIGSSLLKVSISFTPSANLQEQIIFVAQTQTNTRVRIFVDWLTSIRRIQNPSFKIKKGNNRKRQLIKDLDDRIRTEAYAIVRRDAPGILAGNYSGIPVLLAFRCQEETQPDLISKSQDSAPMSEFFRLLASAGTNGFNIYGNKQTNDIYIEQERRSGSELRVLGKYIASSESFSVFLNQILWINTLKEILRLQSRQLDNLQSKILMHSIQKTRKSLASQRLQLYQHTSIYETFTSAHDEEQDLDQRTFEPPGTGLIWEPLPGKAFEYCQHGLESVKWLRSLIDVQIPRLKESYAIAKDEFSDRTILRLQRWAIGLAIAVPISQIILQRFLDLTFPISSPMPSKPLLKQSGDQSVPPGSRDPSFGRRVISVPEEKSKIQPPNNKIQRPEP
ncbi:hypothetical protein [Synechococcus sp. BMK-MC-1]|uniref:hypothetical protein n=1 Tax=Synechococcus sp. BMK-MC-1 TaxID=1442551 RepID=UPI001647EF96|nr:hypothetical protein [Synechococcus sp. BMK-MC-1]QNI68421.1 hypothetical protein SynBMKMC1_02365 [Synechococcus sp. BMK-MC-1]